jgi:hypothetical protein
MALPLRQDLALYRGDTDGVPFRLWQDVIGGTPFDLTGVLARAQIRDVIGGILLVELVVSITLPNEINVSLPASSWAAFPRRSSGVWDLELTYPGAVVRTLVAGAVTISGDVTRAA